MPRPNAKLIRKSEARLTARLVRRWKAQLAQLLERMKALPFAEEPEEGKGACFVCKGTRKLTAGDVTATCSTCRPERKGIEDLQVGDLIDGLDGFRETVEDVVAIARSTYKAGSKFQGQELQLGKYGISFEITYPDAEAYMRRLRSLNLSNFRGSISRTTKDRLQAILTESIRKGRTYDETAKLIKEQGRAGVFSKERGKLIAVNQVGNAHEEGKRKMSQRFTETSGIRVLKSWQTSNDDRVTEECQDYEDMGQIPIDQPFVSDSGTSDQRAPRQTNPRCRCNTAYEAEAPPEE